MYRMESACVSCMGTAWRVVSFLAIAVWIFLVDLQLAAATISTKRDILTIYFMMIFYIEIEGTLFTGMAKTALVTFCNGNGCYGFPSNLIHFAYHHLRYALP